MINHFLRLLIVFATFLPNKDFFKLTLTVYYLTPSLHPLPLGQTV